MTDESDRLPAVAGRAPLPALPEHWSSAPLDPDNLSDAEYAFALWLRTVLAPAAGTPSQGAAAKRMGITSPTLSYLLRGKRISEAAVHALCDGIDRAWGTPAVPAVTTDQRLEGLRRAAAVVDSRPRPSSDQEALYEAEDARHELEQAATARIALEARLSAAQDKVRTLERLLAETHADSAAARVELVRAREEVSRLESDLDSARLRHEQAQEEFDVRRAELEDAIEQEIQERLQVQDELSRVRAELAGTQQAGLADRRTAEMKIHRLERELDEIHIRHSRERLEESLVPPSLSPTVATYLDTHAPGRPTRPTARRLGYASDGGSPRTGPDASVPAARPGQRPRGRRHLPPWPKQFLWGSHPYKDNLARTALLCWLLAQFLVHSIGSGFMQLTEAPDHALWKDVLYAVPGAIIALAAAVAAHLFFTFETDFENRQAGGRVLFALGCVPLLVLSTALLFPHAMHPTQVIGSFLKWPLSH